MKQQFLRFDILIDEEMIANERMKKGAKDIVKESMIDVYISGKSDFLISIYVP
jgi:hypothetical protein